MFIPFSLFFLKFPFSFFFESSHPAESQSPHVPGECKWHPCVFYEAINDSHLSPVCVFIANFMVPFFVTCLANITGNGENRCRVRLCNLFPAKKYMFFSFSLTTAPTDLKVIILFPDFCFSLFCDMHTHVFYVCLIYSGIIDFMLTLYLVSSAGTDRSWSGLNFSVLRKSVWDTMFLVRISWKYCNHVYTARIYMHVYACVCVCIQVHTHK